jgi:autonomous glycyl radical cofactor GrcA
VLELVPLITSVYDLQLVLTLGSTLSEPEAKSDRNVEPVVTVSYLLNAAFGHILAQKLVLDEDACVFFRFMLEHCVVMQVLSASKFMKWEVQATKVNVQSAEWVVELKKHVNANSHRREVHEQAIQTVIKTMHDMHVTIMENREAVVVINDLLTHLQCQGDVGGKRLLDGLVWYTN